MPIPADGSSNGKTGSGGDSAGAGTPAKTETASSGSKKTVGLDKI